MEGIKTYPNLGKQNKFFGLELYDWGILMIVYTFIFLVSLNFFLNLSVVSLAYVLLFFYKRKKANGYTASLFRFLFREKVYSVRREAK